MCPGSSHQQAQTAQMQAKEVWDTDDHKPSDSTRKLSKTGDTSEKSSLRRSRKTSSKSQENHLLSSSADEKKVNSETAVESKLSGNEFSQREEATSSKLKDGSVSLKTPTEADERSVQRKNDGAFMKKSAKVDEESPNFGSVESIKSMFSKLFRKK